jgi:hypothetical protein
MMLSKRYFHDAFEKGVLLSAAYPNQCFIPYDYSDRTTDVYDTWKDLELRTAGPAVQEDVQLLLVPIL